MLWISNSLLARWMLNESNIQLLIDLHPVAALQSAWLSIIFPPVYGKQD